ncbi:MAG: exosome complex protein Rrp42 [Desulfurococcaceae archaeon]|jgi:exosome complex component RRP42|nr:exosome complex protein Rrp42 [Desulfurococcaceae archaeon]
MSITPEREIVPKMQFEQIVKSIKRGERIDGRGLLDYRPISVILSPIKKAEGSALVKLGKTQVITGVKLDLGAPFRDRPNEGVLQVHAEFVPLASPSFEPGPPDENAIEVARIVDRSLREPRAIRLEDLVIEPGRTVWVVYNDIYLIDHDGNIVDSSMLASMLALATVKIPKLIKTESGQYILDKSMRETPLPLNLLVATVTIGVLENTLFVDPTLEEEKVVDTLIVLAVDEKGRICGAQKRGEKSISRKLLENALDIASEKGLQLVSFMRNVLNNPQDYIKPLIEM